MPGHYIRIRRPYWPRFHRITPVIAALHVRMEGDPPSPLEPSSPERMAKRFPDHAAAFNGPLSLQQVGPDHFVRCHNLDGLLAVRGSSSWGASPQQRAFGPAPL